MHDVITAAPTTIRRLYLPRVTFPRLAIGAVVLNLIKAMEIAVTMAYVNPCGTRGSANPNGRDPNW